MSSLLRVIHMEKLNCQGIKLSSYVEMHSELLQTEWVHRSFENFRLWIFLARHLCVYIIRILKYYCVQYSGFHIYILCWRVREQNFTHCFPCARKICELLHFHLKSHHNGCYIYIFLSIIFQKTAFAKNSIHVMGE